jgi:hypothetical protein
MPLKAVIEEDWRRTWWLYWFEFSDTLGGCDRARLEMYFEAIIELDLTSTWMQSIGRQ